MDYFFINCGRFPFSFGDNEIEIEIQKLIEYKLDDERKVKIEFEQNENGLRVIESFEAEEENSAEQQKQGWQNILNNFKKYVENTGN